MGRMFGILKLMPFSLWRFSWVRSEPTIRRLWRTRFFGNLVVQDICHMPEHTILTLFKTTPNHSETDDCLSRGVSYFDPPFSLLNLLLIPPQPVPGGVRNPSFGTT